MATGVLSYRFPPSNPMVSGNQESTVIVTPLNASTAQAYTSSGSSSIIFNFASNTNFLRTQQSYFSYSVVPKDANGNVLTSGVTSSYQGASRAFSRLIVRIGATEIENLVIDDLTAIYYSTLSPAAHRMLNMTEGFGNINAFASGKMKCASQVLSSIWSTPQCIPLPLISAGGGLTVEFVLAPVSNLFTSANVASFDIVDPRMVCTMVSPPADFTVSLVNAIRSGQKSAFMPFTKVRQFRSNGLMSNTNMLVLPIGNVRSVDRLTTVSWDEQAYALRSNDKYFRFGQNALVDYKVEGADLVSPKSSTYAGNGSDAEYILNTYVQEVGSIYNLGENVYIPDNYSSTAFRIQQTYTSEQEQHGSGLSLINAASPNITITTTHSAPVPSTITFNTFVSTSALMEITSQMINVTEVF